MSDLKKPVRHVKRKSLAVSRGIFWLFTLIYLAACNNEGGTTDLSLQILNQLEEPAQYIKVALIPEDIVIGQRVVQLRTGKDVFIDKIPMGTYRLEIYKDYKLCFSQRVFLDKPEKRMNLIINTGNSGRSAMASGGSATSSIDENIDDYKYSWQRFRDSKNAQRLMKKNLFVAMPSREKDMYELYSDADIEKDPVFISSDLVLNTTHHLINYSLRICEVRRLLPLLRKLTNAMLLESRKQYEHLTDSRLKNAALLNYAFFSTAMMLLDENFSPELPVKDAVLKEIDLIHAGNDIQFRPLYSLLNNHNDISINILSEDYSQYQPRGPYRERYKLRQYFKAMMFYGRFNFFTGLTRSETERETSGLFTLQVILMERAMNQNDKATKAWQDINSFLIFTFGENDNLNIRDISRIVNPEISIDDLSDDKILNRIVAKLKRLKQQEIVSDIYFEDTKNPLKRTKSFNFIPQMKSVDGIIFQQLTATGEKELEYLGNKTPATLLNNQRAYPTGLDVMAVLGSERAYRILQKRDDTNYQGFNTRLKLLKKRFQNSQDLLSQRDITSRWLFNLKRLLVKQTSPKLPPVFRKNAWIDKSIYSALASWAQLKHDTMLYTEQPYGYYWGAVFEIKRHEPRGYVEPLPELYAKSAELIKMLKQRVITLHLNEKEIIQKYDDFTSIMESLEIIARKEVKGEMPTVRDYEYIQKVGGRLARLIKFPEAILSEIGCADDKYQDIIVDVFTKPGVDDVLQIGVGKPLNLFVLIDDKGGRRICRGTMLSYYEFHHPASNRFTNAQWRRMGMENSRPEKPAWTQSFIVEE